ncbi:hypothetical protein [Clostridium sp. UBA2485]|uniref:hypothetical protein n=1 Tax=Clostridium sp. UBA2485 TaxID=1946352 RepID=UPI0025BFDEB8|nr:hypothetical protein [Clostridium sp. UBA2485]
MVNKTIRRVNEHTRKLGIRKMPLVTEQSMRIGNTVNKVAGISLITFGLLSSKKWVISIGVASILSNAYISYRFVDK